MTRVTNHLKINLLWYSLAAIGTGMILGTLFPTFAKQNVCTFKTLTTVFVFLMIYPMMINLNLGKFVKIARDPKAVLLSIFYNFVITPILSYAIATLILHNPDLIVGFWLVMLIPGSSMSIGYTGLADGNIEVATISMGMNFILIPFLLPLLLHFATMGSNISIPISSLMKTILVVLIIPMFLGDLTRRLIISKRGEKGFKKIKPLFSLATMLSMLFLIGTIFFMKAKLLEKNWQILIPLALVTIIYLSIMLALITWLNRLFRLNYGEHMGIVFLSTGKNNGTAIAIAMLGFNAMVAIPAAVLPIFQIIFLILYLQLVPVIKRFFGVETSTSG